MATAMERKFTSLRKRLDQMGYRQPLGVESLPLAERLFGDLLHTTESLKNTKVQLSKQKEQKGYWLPLAVFLWLTHPLFSFSSRPVGKAV